MFSSFDDILIHSIGNAERWVLFALVEPVLFMVIEGGLGVIALLLSVPKSLAPLVKARGRPRGLDFALGRTILEGTGEISMASLLSLSGV